MLEVVTRPENQGDLEALGLLIRALETSLYDHHDAFDDYRVSYLGITDSLNEVLLQLLQQYYLRGIHLSCESGKHRLESDSDQRVTVFCLVFSEKTSDFIQYHLSYLSPSASTLTEVVGEVDHLVNTILGKKLVWSDKCATSIACRQEVA